MQRLQSACATFTIFKLHAACRMYGVAMPVEREGYRAHNALYDAELAGRLYFAMRGIA